MQNLFDKAVELFKTKSPNKTSSGNAPPRVARKLFVEEAVNRMMDILDALFEADIALTRLGETRRSLRQLEYDDEICAALESRKEAAICTPWRLEPGAGPVSDFLWEEMEPVMETLLRQSWNAVPYGYSVQEVVYNKRQDGKIGVGQVIEKPFEWFKPKRDGTLRWFPAGLKASRWTRLSSSC
ncbi:MAG: hypothetical protein ACE5G9_14060 [Nitrospinales bacterium]